MQMKKNRVDETIEGTHDIAAISEERKFILNHDTENSKQVAN